MEICQKLLTFFDKLFESKAIALWTLIYGPIFIWWWSRSQRLRTNLPISMALTKPLVCNTFDLVNGNDCLDTTYLCHSFTSKSFSIRNTPLGGMLLSKISLASGRSVNNSKNDLLFFKFERYEIKSECQNHFAGQK